MIETLVNEALAMEDTLSKSIVDEVDNRKIAKSLSNIYALIYETRSGGRKAPKKVKIIEGAAYCRVRREEGP